MYFAQFYSNTVYCILFSTLTPPSTQWHLFENREKFLKHNWVLPVQFPHLTYQFFRGQSCKIFSLIFPEGSGYFCCIQPWKIPQQIQSLTHDKEQNTFTKPQDVFMVWYISNGVCFLCDHYNWQNIHSLHFTWSFFKFTALPPRFESLELCGTCKGNERHLDVLILNSEDNMFIATCVISWLSYPFF